MPRWLSLWWVKMNRLTSLKPLLSLSGEEEDGRLQLALSITEGQMLAYLNRSTLPDALENTLLILAAKGYREGLFSQHTPSSGAITALTRGDVSTHFANPNAKGEDFLNRRQMLNPYRRYGGGP